VECAGLAGTPVVLLGSPPRSWGTENPRLDVQRPRKVHLLEQPQDRIERFRVLYDTAYPKIVAFALRRSREREDAFDVVSETFMVAWRRFDDVPGDEKTAVAWMYGVARRVLANQYRSMDRREALVGQLRLMRRGEGAEESLDVVHEALARLRPPDREILTLSAWDGLDNHEIAEALAVPARTVAVRLHRARNRLSDELGRLGFPAKAETVDRVKSEDGYRTPPELNGTPPRADKLGTS
jgi:RNA polymerase sigma-70 factor, ECF subfamily